MKWILLGLAVVCFLITGLMGVGMSKLPMTTVFHEISMGIQVGITLMMFGMFVIAHEVSAKG